MLEINVLVAYIFGVAGKTIGITVDEGGAVRMVDVESGEVVQWTISFWFSWAAFHKDTEVF